MFATIQPTVKWHTLGKTLANISAAKPRFVLDEHQFTSDSSSFLARNIRQGSSHLF